MAFIIGLNLILIPAGLIVIINKLISLSTRSMITDKVEFLPSNAICLVFGSGNTADPVRRNYSFSSRMDKAGELYRSGKVNKIIVSGISNKALYNEPNDMKKELVAMQIPAFKIYPDHGGLRTFKSVMRAKKLHPNDYFILISQRRQLEKALFISKNSGLRAWGLEASSTKETNTVFEDIYEMFSRVKCIGELLLTKFSYK